MTTRAFFKVAFLGFLVIALAPGYAAAAGQGQDLTEMLASNAAAQATAVSGPVIMVSPLSLDFGVLDNGTSAALSINIANTGDQTLNISSLTYSDAAYSSPGVSSIPAGGNTNLLITFQPNDGQMHSATLTIASNASNGSAMVILDGQANAEPTLNAIGDKTVTAFTTLAFTVTATDADDTVDDELTFSMGAGLPPSATFNGSSGEFSWTPTSAEMGNYSVSFTVSDGRLSDSETIDIAVTVTNQPPTANAGGSYLGATGRPLQFSSAGSSDPDIGQTLSYAWDFGDGMTATGPSPMHTYLIPGDFIATLTVCDNGSPQLCDADFAAVTIQTEIGAQIILANGSSTIDARKTGSKRS
ncbi:MAG: PKD domain-containing protein, partial [Acidobacteria bacterium]